MSGEATDCRVAPVLGAIQNAPNLFIFWCPGCKYAHPLDTKRWKWNGDLVKPTATPSLLLKALGDRHPRCHLFIKDGQLRFLKDCTHDLAGQTVEMEPWPPEEETDA